MYLNVFIGLGITQKSKSLIVFSTFGVRYKSYCSNIARTFLVDPSEKIQAMYELLVDAEEHILSELKDGAKLSDVYNSTVDMVKKEKPELVSFKFCK